MANAAQVNIRLIENRRDWTFDFGAKWTVWKVENGRFAIGTSIIGHFLLKINTKIIFLQQSLVYIVCAICWTLIFSLFYSIFFFVGFKFQRRVCQKDYQKLIGHLRMACCITNSNMLKATNLNIL